MVPIACQEQNHRGTLQLNSFSFCPIQCGNLITAKHLYHLFIWVCICMCVYTDTHTHIYAHIQERTNTHSSQGNVAYYGTVCLSAPKEMLLTCDLSASNIFIAENQTNTTFTKLRFSFRLKYIRCSGDSIATIATRKNKMHMKCQLFVMVVVITFNEYTNRLLRISASGNSSLLK